jgi:hypothetical protein
VLNIGLQGAEATTTFGCISRNSSFFPQRPRPESGKLTRYSNLSLTAKAD